MDCCSQPGLLPLASALENMRAALTPMADTEMVSLGQSLDRVLAAPLVSPINVPAYDNSAMDGYALRHADASLTQPLQIIGQSLAGHAFAGELAAGQCIRIMTGATLPANADCVIMQEQTQVTGEQLHLLKMPRLNDNIRRAGEDIAQGAAVYAQGQRISPVDIGLIASLGVAQLHVYRRLKVAVFSTGDELTPPGQPLASGHIYDSNRYTLLALLQRLGVEIIDLGFKPGKWFPEAIDHINKNQLSKEEIITYLEKFKVF